MNVQQVLAFLRDMLAFQLFSIGGTPVTTSTLLFAGGLFLGTLWMSFILRKAVGHWTARRGVNDEGAVATAQRLIHYVVLIMGIGLVLELVGVDLTTLFAAGAIVAVGLGFAMQNIVQNFVSGVILLVERTITPTDVLEVEGTVVKVTRMGIRATVARTRDEEELIVPNSALVQSTVKNYTLEDGSFRIRTRVGVAYSSDLDQVQATLLSTATALEGRLSKFAPIVLLIEFGNSSIVFETSVWIADPWGEQGVRSRLNMAIWRALKREGITIAFPQLDVHLDPGSVAPLDPGVTAPSEPTST